MHNPKNSLPNGWSLKKLGEIAKITSGGTPDRSKPSYWNGEYPWISTSLIDFNVIEKSEEYITEEGLSNSSAKLFPIGTILMAMYGQGKTRGKVALLGMEAATNQACAAIILNNGQTITDFVFQNLASRYEEIRGLSNVGNQENLNGELIKGLPVKLPTLAELKKIATILGTWDAALQTTTALLNALQKRKKGLMQQLLSPKPDWKEVRLGEVGSFSKGSGITKEELIENGIPCIRYGEIYTVHHFVIRKYHSFISEQTASSSKQIKQNDILFAGSGETLEDIGKAVAFIGTDEVYAGGDLIIFSPQGGDSIFLSYIINSAFVRKQIRAFGQGQSVVHLYSRDIEKLKIHLPPFTEQTRIAAILNAADAELRQTEVYLEKLKTQKRGLMQQLLTGKVRVTTR